MRLTLIHNLFPTNNRKNNNLHLTDAMVFNPRLKRWHQTGDPAAAASASASSRKKQWSIFERRPISVEAGMSDHKSCLKTKRSYYIFGATTNRKAKASFVSVGNLRKPAEAKKVTFNEYISGSDSFNSIPSYYYDDDSIIDDSRYDDYSHLGHQAGCEACDVTLYQPESLPAIYTRDQSDSVLGMSTSHQEEHIEPMINDGNNLNEYLNLMDINESSNSVLLGDVCEKVKMGFSTATATLWESYTSMLSGSCILESLNGSSVTSDSRSQHNFDWDRASKKTTSTPLESCRSQVSETHYFEGRDETESSYDELMTTIPNLSRVMEVVDDALFPVDTTQFRGNHEEIGTKCSKFTKEVNASNNKRGVLNKNRHMSKRNPTSTSGANINKDATVVSAVLNNYFSQRRRRSKSCEGSNTNVAVANTVVNKSVQVDNEDKAIESAVFYNQVDLEDKKDPLLYKSMNEMNNEKSVSWANYLHIGTGIENNTLKAAEHTMKVSASKVSREKTRIVPDESISSKMRNFFKNATTNNTLLGGAPKPATSIEPASQWYLFGDKRDGNQVQPFTGVRSATCNEPKTILATEDGESAISSWRDAVADTVAITPRSMEGNIAKPQVHTQKPPDIYPPAMSFHQRQIAQWTLSSVEPFKIQLRPTANQPSRKKPAT